MQFPVNRPTALAAVSVSPTMTITVVPSGPGAPVAQIIPGGAPDLTINDATTLAAANPGNAIWSVPLAELLALGTGTVVNLGTTTNGLVVSAVPPGVAVLMNF